MKQLVWTYRKWKDTWEVFYIMNYDWEDNNYYCEYSDYLDSYRFDKDFILEESKKASIFDILKYKLECLIYKI